MMVFVLGICSGGADRPISVTAREFAGRLGRGFQENREFGFAKAEGAETNGRAHFPNKGGGQCRRLAQASGAPRPLKGTNHAPVGECMGPGVNGAAGHELSEP
ncbi:MAG: hypothetical protein RL091_2626 [Verrucomicrobiota bacterium]